MGGGTWRRKKRERQLTLSCALPQDVLEGGARVTLFGRDSVMVEGQHGVVELGKTRMRLRTKSGMVTVLGENLVLRELSADAAMIVSSSVAGVIYDMGISGKEGGTPCL